MINDLKNVSSASELIPQGNINFFFFFDKLNGGYI